MIGHFDPGAASRFRRMVSRTEPSRPAIPSPRLTWFTSVSSIGFVLSGCQQFLKLALLGARKAVLLQQMHYQFAGRAIEHSIHQVLQKTEGNIKFHTACSTAFPQPAPGQAESPGPIKNVPAEKLRSMLGLARVDYVAKDRMLAVVDTTLE